MKKTVLREEFLKKFIETVIKEKAKEQEKFVQLEMVQVPQMEIPPEKIMVAPEPTAPPMVIRKRTIIRRLAIPTETKQPVPASQKTAFMPQQIPRPKLAKGPATLDQLEQFLADPVVISVECTGPGRPLLINRGGTIQATSLGLSSEEINNITNEISDQTHIPLVPGMFKAVLGNYTITAVISEFAGTRFIIQKRYSVNP